MKKLLEYLWTVYLAVAAMSTAFVFKRYEGDETWIYTGILFVALGYPIWKGKRNVEYRLLLKEYEERLEPIYEWQEAETDPSVFERVQEHKLLLTESGNKHFENGKLDVVAFYFRDPNFDYCETWAQYEQRVQDGIRDHKRAWAKEAFGGDEMKRIQFLHCQRVAQPLPNFVFKSKAKEAQTV